MRERLWGIEPQFFPWQGKVIALIRQPQVSVLRIGLEPISEVFQTTAVTILATSANVVNYTSSGPNRDRTYDLYSVNVAL